MAEAVAEMGIDKAASFFEFLKYMKNTEQKPRSKEKAQGAAS